MSSINPEILNKLNKKLGFNKITGIEEIDKITYSLTKTEFTYKGYDNIQMF